MLPTLASGAQDGTALYKSKCAACHGASGEGKPAMKAPALRGTPLTADQITEHTMKGTVNSKPPTKGRIGYQRRTSQSGFRVHKDFATRSEEQVAWTIAELNVTV
jgi:cytochrome c5